MSARSNRDGHILISVDILILALSLSLSLSLCLWFVFRGESPDCHLYVGVVKKIPPPPLTGEQYGKIEPKYQSGLRPQGVFHVPLYF